MRDAEMFLERALIEDGLLTSAGVAEVRRYALKQDQDFVEALVSSGMLSTREVALCRAAMCEVPYVSLSDYQPCHSNAQLISRSVAQRHDVFPLFVIDNVLTLAMEDPMNLEATDQVRQVTRCEIDPVLCEREELKALIARAYSMTTAAEGGEAESTVEFHSETDGLNEESPPIVAAVNQLLSDAIAERASDVHVNPDEDRVHLRYRIDGVLHVKQGPPLGMHRGIVQRLKVMAKLDLTQSRRPQDGRFRFTPSLSSGSGQNGKRVSTAMDSVDVRISTVPTVCGENVVMRLLARAQSVPTFPELGMSCDTITQLTALLEQPYGMILVSGPTGSGKTTTLYAGLNKLNDPKRNVMTIEDPVEIRMPYVRQIQANPEIGLTFASALRSILRQDPDVVLVGEIRDADTATIALQAALTGHMVLSTVHTNDAAGAVARLRDFGLPSFVINSAVLGVIAQRLLRRVCESCAEPVDPASVSPELLKRLKLTSGDGRLLRGQGCRKCGQSGYRGRIGVYELLQFTANVRDAVEQGVSTDHIRDTAVQDGLKLMWCDALEKAQIGLTTLEEVASIAAMSHMQDMPSVRDTPRRRKAA